MLKKSSIIFSVLVVASLGCMQSGQIVGAEEEIKEVLRPGTAIQECKLLEKGLSILVERNPKTLCAETVTAYKSNDCTGKSTIVRPEDRDKKLKLPKGAFSGAGNQYCPEAFVYYQNSPFCFQYTSGGRTRYIPPG
jgi:hypothetical protein